MKKVLIGLALVAAIATAFAVPAFSTPSSSVPTRVKALEAKVKTLTTRLNRTQALATVSAAKLSCLKNLMPVSSYGDGTTSGYVYTQDARATSFLTSALDVTEQGQTPGAWVALVESSCIGSSSSSMQLRAHGGKREAMRRFQPAFAAH
jgi:hypothetical protein